MPEPPRSTQTEAISKPPTGLAILLLVGPSLVWCAEYIGSGEVILATRTGAVLGTTVIWAVIAGIFLKYWIGMSGARYTVCTGEGMIDMFDRIPGPSHWAVWIVLLAQIATAAISIGSLASAAGIFVGTLLPVTPYVGGWLVTIFAVLVVWSGGFEVLKVVMSFFVVIIVLGVLYVAVHVFPGVSVFLQGLIPSTPQVPGWAVDLGVSKNPWSEILPLLGWSAGGFASQVWYTYWVMGAGYGATRGVGYGRPADPAVLRRLTRLDAERLKGWCRVVYADATLAMVIGTVVTVGFLIAAASMPRKVRAWRWSCRRSFHPGGVRREGSCLSSVGQPPSSRRRSVNSPAGRACWPTRFESASPASKSASGGRRSSASSWSSSSSPTW